MILQGRESVGYREIENTEQDISREVWPKTNSQYAFILTE